MQHDPERFVAGNRKDHNIMNSESHIARLYPNHCAALTKSVWQRKGREYEFEGGTEVSMFGLDEFEVVKQLGTGAYGTVYLARVVSCVDGSLRVTNRSVALKVFEKGRLRRDLRVLGKPQSALDLAYSEVEATWDMLIRHAPMVYHVLDSDTAGDRCASDVMGGAPVLEPVKTAESWQLDDEWLVVAQEYMSGGQVMQAVDEMEFEPSSGEQCLPAATGSRGGTPQVDASAGAAQHVGGDVDGGLGLGTLVDLDAREMAAPASALPWEGEGDTE